MVSQSGFGKMEMGVGLAANRPQTDGFEKQLDALAARIEEVETYSKYQDSEWYRDVWFALTRVSYPLDLDRVQIARLKRRCRNFETIGDDLFFQMRGVRRKYVTLQEISEVIRHAHDKEGHWKHAITMKKLRKYYWPNMANDVRNNILRCMKCAQHGNAQRTQTQSPTVIDREF
ncbi:hypothetical protein K3495_g10756 [Podosphaera aphanis]|nr:hypothetical protein K3495_g10756 [Podosphaera aphanis]